ncbi:MAG TPA: peptide deformylase, partial [Flexilinea sp.]|jgi:peptide deformylase|nr:MAG: Peptide deformylase [Chloroflexi bacterium ADurb.Bin344]HPJ65370.1 peptide deformylase [Flexilinea sp.]HPR69918.1 peptide deformylase [Flexilinea sp.]HQF80581.1 peptide deformylase [Flexilinea sp.]HQG89278.1 peptide deformylase [Flexilinea sp.]
MILEVKQTGDPILRRKAHKITRIDSSIRKLASDMLETMRENNGVGLAAPQIGESIRLIVVEYPENDEIEDSPLISYKLINPEITWMSEEKTIGVEGCLSFRGLAGEVERAESVKIRALNIHGKPFNITANGWLARIFQHEIDHLDGICYVDRANKVWEMSAEEEEETEQDESITNNPPIS